MRTLAPPIDGTLTLDTMIPSSRSSGRAGCLRSRGSLGGALTEHVSDPAA